MTKSEHIECPYLSSKQAAAYFGVCYSTFQRWSHNPDFPAPVKCPNGFKCWKKDELIKFLDKATIKSRHW